MNLTTIKDKLIAFGRKVWAYMKVAKIELIVIAALIFADLVSKGIIGLTMHEGQDVTAIPNFLHIHYIRNYHAAFGSAFGLEKILGKTAIRVIFIIITIAAIGVFGYFLHKNRGKNLLMRLSLAMIIAGAFGNLVDRLFLGYVRDFIEIYFFGLDIPKLGTSFAIFNIADAELTVGVICFLVYFIFLYHEPKKEEKTAPAASVEGETYESMPENAGIGERGQKSPAPAAPVEGEAYESMPENAGIGERGPKSPAPAAPVEGETYESMPENAWIREAAPLDAADSAEIPESAQEDGEAANKISEADNKATTENTVVRPERADNGTPPEISPDAESK